MEIISVFLFHNSIEKLIKFPESVFFKYLKSLGLDSVTLPK